MAKTPLRIEGEGSLGLFGYLGSGAVVSELGLEDASIGGTASYAGGLAGFNGGSVSHCYSTAAVTGDDYVGGLVGYNSGSVASSFWDTETSGLAVSDGGVGLTRSQMQDMGTYLDAGWDFLGETDNGVADIWWMDDGQDYPHLWWKPDEKN